MIKKKASITPKKAPKQFVYPESLPVADFLHMYEFFCHKNFLLADVGYRTWPDVTIEEAYTKVIESGITIDDVVYDGSHISESYKQSRKLFANLGEGKINPDDLKSAFIERRCYLGYAIPLLMQFCPDLLAQGPDLRLTFVYSWAACIKEKLIAETRAAKLAERHSADTPSYRGKLVTFEIECSLAQAQMMDDYIQIRGAAYDHWSEHLKGALKDKRRVTAGAPDSKVITEFRKQYEGDVPRSLIKRSMHHATADWQKWLDAKRQHGKHPSMISKKSLNSVSLSSSCSINEMGTTLTFGEIQNIPIVRVTAGELEPTKEFKYLIVNARVSKKSLVYIVTGQYKK
ncbi:hypothetical protein pEaSNUABM28_00223 [Erwinia phage pEa_SNUABM_28]|nr:hypothetical protein pEaSNUABM28_00223 [Erwinia phage pEa_SNUABM_28]